MKKVHLICNAHIDPIWQWDWEEGASCVLSTFQSAINLSKDFDYIFNHNESQIYEYTSRFSPDLFECIAKANKEGTWKVMGGWFNQPDCILTNGESIVRQIQTGKQYFLSNFNEFPKTAVNFDPFGHSRGIVQILNKCGQNNYLFMRPLSKYTDPNRNELEMPTEQFVWVGYDDSTVKATRTTSYGCSMGLTLGKIKDDISKFSNYEVICSCWGVGNHGGGPSRHDLGEITNFIKTSDLEIIHSTPDQYFNDINPTTRYEKSLIPSMPGCYTSQASTKQAYRNFERELFYTEKMCSVASLEGKMVYPFELIKDAVRDMLNVEFHDVFSGTTIQSGEKNAERFINHGLKILNECRADAFFSLIKGQPVAEENTWPIFVFNPKGYKVDQYVECEACFQMPFDYDNSNETLIDIYDEKGNYIPTQTIKEEANISQQFRKRFIFKTSLKPLDITRFTAKYHVRSKKEKNYTYGNDINFDNGSMQVFISKDSGLIEKFIIDGIQYNNGPIFEPEMWQDYEDPWGMKYPYVGWDPVKFKHITNPKGVFENLKSMEVVEDGDVYLGVETFFECEDSLVRILYKLFKKDNIIDTVVDVYPNNINKCFKIRMPLKGTNFAGEQMFGYEELFTNGNECIAHDYLTLKEQNGKYLEIITPDTYGSSFKDGAINISLMRSATYCAHPVPYGPLVEPNRYISKIDSGKRTFNFRIQLAGETDLKRNADVFIEKPYALNIFPTIEKASLIKSNMLLSSDKIHLVTIKKADMCEGYIIRLENNSSQSIKGEFSLFGKTLKLEFSKYEVKTLVYDKDNLCEIKELLI